MREARSPSSAYGSRVHRGLRGRWFSLVPVKRRALLAWCAVVGAVVAILCLGHYASVAWPSVAYRPEIARALRLDRPDSFGRWFTCVLLSGSAGASLLIYQLRRHKNDDFRGHYRLWRIVLAVLLLASVDALVSLVDWTGAILDAGFRKRVALSGEDWIGIVLSVGGAVLALRLTVEVRRSRWALVTIVMAWAVLAFPVAARWNVLAVESISRWVLVTAAPLLGSALIFVSLGGYLRMLYREVRRIEDKRSIADRLSDMRLRVFSPSEKVDATKTVGRRPKRKVDRKNDESDTDVQEKDARRVRGWFGRIRKHRERPKPDPVSTSNEDNKENKEHRQREGDAKVAQEPRRKRGWFGSKTKTKTEAESSDVDESTTPDTPKRSRFSMRLRPKSKSALSDDSASASQTDGRDDQTPPKSTKKLGLGGWMRRGKDVADDAGSAEVETSTDDSRPSESDAGEDIDVDAIDWSSMSKAERRRLRKKLKRQGRAA